MLLKNLPLRAPPFPAKTAILSRSICPCQALGLCCFTLLPLLPLLLYTPHCGLLFNALRLVVQLACQCRRSSGHLTSLPSKKCRAAGPVAAGLRLRPTISRHAARCSLLAAATRDGTPLPAGRPARRSRRFIAAPLPADHRHAGCLATAPTTAWCLYAGCAA